MYITSCTIFIFLIKRPGVFTSKALILLIALKFLANLLIVIIVVVFIKMRIGMSLND